MNLLHALIAAFLQQWKTTMTSVASTAFLFGMVPLVSVLAWIAHQSGDLQMLNYVWVGAPLLAIWYGVIFRIGWSLNMEFFGKTMEFILISRTPVMVMMLGKALAQVAYGIPNGIITLVPVLLICGRLPVVSEVELLLPALILVMIGITVTSLSLAPILILLGGSREGSFNAIMPLGVVLSGFVFPVDQLPWFLEIPARLLPTSWAMESVWQLVQGPDSWWLVIKGWVFCILLSSLWFAGTHFLFKQVEKRIRITGTLGTY